MLAGFLLAACLSTHAEVKLPAIFSDGMVMQQQTNAMVKSVNTIGTSARMFLTFLREYYGKDDTQ